MLTLAHRLSPPRAENMRRDLHNFAKKRDWSFLLSGVDERKSHRLWPAKKPLGALLCNALKLLDCCVFLALPSPRAEGGLLCEGACSSFPRRHAAQTSGQHVDAVDPIFSASIGHPPNLTKAGAALSHWSLPCEPDHAGTRLHISLQFSIFFIANIARKRPELNRDKSI